MEIGDRPDWTLPPVEVVKKPVFVYTTWTESQLLNSENRQERAGIR